MDIDSKKIAGLLLFIGAAQFILGIMISEALYSGYSISQNYISDLGVGPSALIYNSSLFFLGILGIASTYFIQRAFKSSIFTVLLALVSIGAVGVSIFTENFQPIHTILSLITFAFGGISAIASYRFEQPPLSYVSVILGAVTLSALVLGISGINLNLGVGGIERLVAYPELLWMMGFGAHLIGDSGTHGNNK